MMPLKRWRAIHLHPAMAVDRNKPQAIVRRVAFQDHALIAKEAELRNVVFKDLDSELSRHEVYLDWVGTASNVLLASDRERSARAITAENARVESKRKQSAIEATIESGLWADKRFFASIKALYQSLDGQRFDPKPYSILMASIVISVKRVIAPLSPIQLLIEQWIITRKTGGDIKIYLPMMRRGTAGLKRYNRAKFG